MNRRFAVLSLLWCSVAASRAYASPEPSATPDENWVTMTGVGLPIIVQGRVLNHVFVELKLHLKPGQALDEVRARDAFMRDGLVRAAHLRPFVLSDDYNRIDERALAAALMTIANREVGRGAVIRVEVVRQTPRMRVRNPAPARPPAA